LIPKFGAAQLAIKIIGNDYKEFVMTGNKAAVRTTSFMDDVTAAISSFVAESHTKVITPEAADAVVTHLVDAFGCAIAATGSEPCRIVKEVAGANPSASGASVIGLATRCTPELAAFANSSMVRSLDFNDTYNSKSGGHPSVIFPGVLAVSEINQLTGHDVIRGVFVASEVYGALCDAVSLRDNGWDAGAFVSVASAAGVASVLKLSAEATAHAVSLGITSGIPLGVIRAGTLSAWKGCAEGHAVMNGVLFARLAAQGMTGPARPFLGTNGFLEQVARPLELQQVGGLRDGKTVLERTAIKFLPVQWSAQAPVELFLRLHDQLVLEDIESITIHGYDFLLKSVGGGRNDVEDKWDPKTRETADHSLAYLTAVALTDGAVTLDSYRPARVLDAALRPLMQKITIVEDPATRGLPPGRQPVDVVVVSRGGKILREHCEFPRGHVTNPPTPKQVDDKFMELAGRVLDTATASEILMILRGVASQPDLTGLAAALRNCP
jgi:2-methylcitrate dehydratase